jgi:FixJ family two-component response regulator
MMQSGGAVHLFLTDIDMPGGGGYALRRQLAATWPALPVVYMSDTTLGLARQAKLASSEHFIEKPFPADRLQLAIGLVLQPGVPGLPATTGSQEKETP